MNDRERELWVKNDEGLYRFWRSTRLSMRNFLRQYRDEIDAAIDRVLNPPKRTGFLGRLLGLGGQTRLVRGKATRVTRVDGILQVWYHRTPVVTVDAKKIVLDTGGWKTRTTKTRMNQASNEFGLGYHVFVEGREWFVNHKGRILPFTGDTLTLKR